MKKNTHPTYREVVFLDVSANVSILTRSCAETDETIKWSDGNEYPLYKLEISSASHPFFTGKMKFLDTTGRVEKFQKKYQKSASAYSKVAKPMDADDGKDVAPAPDAK